MVTGHALPEFTIDPREGTVAGPVGTVRLEPRVMEVLSILSSHPGRVVSREELLDAVWPGVVVTEHTLSRCIYVLRRELAGIVEQGDQGTYNPIETLPKRGYRLLGTFRRSPPQGDQTPTISDNRLPLIPYVVGQWVRGDRFYGRGAQIAEVLDGQRNFIWLLGTRRIGKTSLLKQIELIAGSASKQQYFPVYWDFQGVDTAAELHLNFSDALLDAEDRLARIGIELKDIEADDLFVSLDRLRRQLRTRSLRLLLLCDEVEELIGLQRADPSLLRKLRHALQSRDGIRTVLASTIRLWELAELRDDTSPFLHGFTPPLYIERLSDDETLALVTQSHLPADERPVVSADIAEMILKRCDNHPYLVQLVCKRYVESGNMDEATEQVATDSMVSYFFAVDFDMLTASEREIVRLIARLPRSDSSVIRDQLSLRADELEGTLRRLESLGFLHRRDDGTYAVANYFFRRWLDDLRDDSKKPAGVPASHRDDGGAASDGSGADQTATVGIVAELKRRNVFRVGFAYLVVAWMLLQVGDVVFDFLEVPLWAGKLLIVFLGLGFPVALILAWAFELTPEGLMREKDIERSATRRPASRRLETVIIIVLLVAVLMFAWDRFA